MTIFVTRRQRQGGVDDIGDVVLAAAFLYEDAQTL
jgi:hypothetical protein